MKWFTIMLSSILILAITVGCTTPQIDLPDREVPITEEAAKSLESKITTIKASPSGDVKLTFTESEITSYINLRLVNQNFPLKKPVIWFSEGKVYMKGRLETDGIPVKGDAILVVALSVKDGRLNINVERAIIGRVPVPESVLKQLSDLANERLSAVTGPLPVKELQILEGETIILVRRQ